jgi:branched-chain amino acid transport system permease protein
VLGPVVGAWIFVILEEMIWAQFLELNRAILGVAIVLLIFMLPAGLLGLRLPTLNWRAIIGLRDRVPEAQ